MRPHWCSWTAVWVVSESRNMQRDIMVSMVEAIQARASRRAASAVGPELALREVMSKCRSALAMVEPSGRLDTTHVGRASRAWKAFKERFGQSVQG